MSPDTPVEDQPKKTAAERLAELRRALQRKLHRKPTAYEATALQRAALLMLRAEMAALDPKSDSTDVVRLDNAARRARIDFERFITKRKATSMADLEREIAHAHA